MVILEFEPFPVWPPDDHIMVQTLRGLNKTLVIGEGPAKTKRPLQPVMAVKGPGDFERDPPRNKEILSRVDEIARGDIDRVIAGLLLVRVSGRICFSPFT